MTKRRISPAPIDNTPDLLVKNKVLFGSELAERIQVGESLLVKQIERQEELYFIRQEYTFWNDYNAEFLKRAFNRTDNQFFKDYTYEHQGIIVGSMFGADRSPSFNQIVQETRSKISQKLNRLKLIHGKLNLIDEIDGLEKQSDPADVDVQTKGIQLLDLIFSKFHKVAQDLRHRHANRETLIIRDEYDVQDLLHSLLLIHFDDVRSEDYSPSYAGANSRTDFVLKEEKIVVEVEMTNDNLTDREVGSQLLIDIGRYRGHPDCKALVVFVYDKQDHIRNKTGLINDLERMSTSNLGVKVFIYPR